MKKVKLDDIALAIGADANEGLWFLDTESGITEFVAHNVMDTVLRVVEIPVDLPADIRLMYKLAKEVIFDDDDRFVKLPGQLDVLEWDIMRRFAVSRPDPQVANELTASIQGANAFQAFNAGLRKHKLQQQWQAHREELLHTIAAEWCVQHGIPFDE